MLTREMMREQFPVFREILEEQHMGYLDQIEKDTACALSPFMQTLYLHKVLRNFRKSLRTIERETKPLDPKTAARVQHVRSLERGLSRELPPIYPHVLRDPFYLVPLILSWIGFEPWLWYMEYPTDLSYVDLPIDQTDKKAQIIVTPAFQEYIALVTEDLMRSENVKGVAVPWTHYTVYVSREHRDAISKVQWPSATKGEQDV